MTVLQNEWLVGKCSLLTRKKVSLHFQFPHNLIKTDYKSSVFSPPLTTTVDLIIAPQSKMGRGGGNEGKCRSLGVFIDFKKILYVHNSMNVVTVRGEGISSPQQHHLETQRP